MATDIVAAIITTAGALGGVYVGSFIQSRGAASAAGIEIGQRRLADRRQAYVNLLAAARAMRRHLQTADIAVRLVASPNGEDVPLLADDGKHWADFEAAQACVQIVADGAEIYAAVAAIRHSLYELIRARNSCAAGAIPGDVVGNARDAEDAFAAAARSDLS